MYVCALMIVCVDVVDCVHGADGGCGYGNYYLVAEPKSPRASALSAKHASPTPGVHSCA